MGKYSLRFDVKDFLKPASEFRRSRAREKKLPVVQKFGLSRLWWRENGVQRESRNYQGRCQAKRTTAACFPSSIVLVSFLFLATA